MKKILIGIFIIIIVIAVVLWFLFRPSSQSSNSNSASLPTPSDQLSPLYQVPTSSTITLGTPHGLVIVNNFYKIALGAEDQFIVIARNDSYGINYDTDNSGFDIDIKQPPFDANRAAAETDFLKLLGVDQPDACKLAVAVEAEAAANGGLGGESLPLSFCATSTFGK
jgi:hypothetical protein